MHSQISPVFFLVGTKLDTQSEYLTGAIICASNILLTSFLTKGNKIGLILLSFFEKVFYFLSKEFYVELCLCCKFSSLHNSMQRHADILSKFICI